MIKRLLIASVLMVGVGAKAQGPCFTYSDNYATYTSVSMSADGSTIYATTEVSGSGSMTFLNQCSGINYGSIHHTPMAIAMIHWNNGQNTTGGPVYGSAECPDCYIDISSTASVAASTASSYTYSYVGQVNCNFAGNILEVSGTDLISSGSQWTTYENAGAPPPTCAYTMACLPGELPACPQEGYLYLPPDSRTGQCDSPGIEVNGGWLSINGGTPFCFGIVSQAVKVPGPCGFTTH